MLPPATRGQPNRERQLITRVLKQPKEIRDYMQQKVGAPQKHNLERQNQYLLPWLPQDPHNDPNAVLLVRYQIQLVDHTWRTQTMLVHVADLQATQANSYRGLTTADLQHHLRVGLADDPLRYLAYDGTEIPGLQLAPDSTSGRMLPVIGNYLDVTVTQERDWTPVEIRRLLHQLNNVPDHENVLAMRAIAHRDTALHTQEYDNRMDVDEEDEEEDTAVTGPVDLTGINVLLEVIEEMEQELGPIDRCCLEPLPENSPPEEEEEEVEAMKLDVSEDAAWCQQYQHRFPGLRLVELPPPDPRIQHRPRPTPCPTPGCDGHCGYEILARIVLLDRLEHTDATVSTDEHAPTTEQLDNAIAEIFAWFHVALGVTSICEGLTPRLIHAWCGRHATPEKPHYRHTYICISPLREIVYGDIVPYHLNNSTLRPVIIVMSGNWKHMEELTVESERRRYIQLLTKQQTIRQCGGMGSAAHRLCRKTTRQTVNEAFEIDDGEEDVEEEEDEEEAVEEGTDSETEEEAEMVEEETEEAKEVANTTTPKKKIPMPPRGYPLLIPPEGPQRTQTFAYDVQAYALLPPDPSPDADVTTVHTTATPPSNRVHIPADWIEPPNLGCVEGLDALLQHYDPNDLPSGGGNRLVFDLFRPYWLPLPGKIYHPLDHPERCTHEAVLRQRKDWKADVAKHFRVYNKRMKAAKKKIRPPYYVIVCTNLEDLGVLQEWAQRTWPPETWRSGWYDHSGLREPNPHSIRLENVIWVANPMYLRAIRPLHLKLTPSQPFQPGHATVTRYAQQLFLDVGNRLLPHQATHRRWPETLAPQQPLQQALRYPIMLCASVYPRLLADCLDTPSVVAKPRLMQHNAVNPYGPLHTHREHREDVGDLLYADPPPPLGDPLRPHCCPLTKKHATLQLSAQHTHSHLLGPSILYEFRAEPWSNPKAFAHAVRQPWSSTTTTTPPPPSFPPPHLWGTSDWTVQLTAAEFACVEEQIPKNERFRVDLIRSYTAMILLITLGTTQLEPGAHWAEFPAHTRCVFPIHAATDPWIPITDTNRHTLLQQHRDDPRRYRLPVGHYCVHFAPVDTEMPRERRLRRYQLFCIPPTGGEQWVSYLFLEDLLQRDLVTPAEVRGFVPTHNHIAEDKLAATLATYVQYVLEFPEFQTYDKAAGEVDLTKMLVNYLIGYTNRTATATYEYHSPEDLDPTHLLYTMLRVQAQHPTATVGIRHPRRKLPVDPHQPLLPGGGCGPGTHPAPAAVFAREYQPRVLQFQSVYRMILEKQAIQMFDLLCQLPRAPGLRLIQLNIDALEYHRPRTCPPERDPYQPHTVDTTGLTPADLLHRGLLGRYKPEAPRGPERHNLYEPRSYTHKEEALVQHYLRQAPFQRTRNCLTEVHPLELPRREVPNDPDEDIPLPNDLHGLPLLESEDRRLPLGTRTTPLRLVGQYPAVQLRHDIAHYCAWRMQRIEHHHPHPDPVYPDATETQTLPRLLAAYVRDTSDNTVYRKYWPGLSDCSEDYLLSTTPTCVIDPKRSTPRCIWYHLSVNTTDPALMALPFVPGAIPNPLNAADYSRDYTLRILLQPPGHTDAPRHRPRATDIACFDFDLLEIPSYAGLLIQGAAGTGKTHTVRMLKDYAASTLKLRVITTAFTHQACRVLGPDAHTLHSVFRLPTTNNPNRLLHAFLFERHRFGFVDVLIVDEISMVPYVLWLCLLLYHRTRPHTRIILAGDPYQLPPVQDPHLKSLVEQYKRWHHLQHGSTTPDLQWFDAQMQYLFHSDVLHDLLFDSIHQRPGTWIQLHGCRRTDDPLVALLAPAPWERIDHIPTELLQPVARATEPTRPFRWLSPTNALRMALNAYGTCRWLFAHPNVHPRVTLVLPVVYAVEQAYPDSKLASIPYTTYRQQHSHTRYLQSTIYAPGMPTLCRSNACVRTWVDGLRTAASRGQPLQLRNNRFAVILGVRFHPVGHLHAGTPATVQLQWADQDPPAAPTPDLPAQDTVVRRFDWEEEVDENRALHRANAKQEVVARRAAQREAAEDPEDRPTHKRPKKAHTKPSTIPKPSTTVTSAPSTAETDVTFWISAFDLTFHFLPAFATTVHTTQGVTLREPHVLADWTRMRYQAPMAYTALTRAAHPTDRYLWELPHNPHQPPDTDPMGYPSTATTHPLEAASARGTLHLSPTTSTPPTHHLQTQPLESLFSAWFQALLVHIRRMQRPSTLKTPKKPTTKKSKTDHTEEDNVEVAEEEKDAEAPEAPTKTPNCVADLPVTAVDPMDDADVAPAVSWDAPELYAELDAYLRGCVAETIEDRCHHCAVRLTKDDPYHYVALLDPEDPKSKNGAPTRMPVSIVRICAVCNSHSPASVI